MSRKLPTEIATALINTASDACLALWSHLHQIQSAGVCKSPADYATILNAFVDRLGEVMTESNILPYDGQAILIDDHGAEFDWPAITRALIDTIPWQVDTARFSVERCPFRE